MKLKVLTANIAFGLPEMNKLIPNAIGHIAVHRWTVPFYFIAKFAIRSYSNLPNGARYQYLKSNSNLRNIMTLISHHNPDVVVLNELLFQVHKDKIEKFLRKKGFKVFSWGLSKHYIDSTVSTLTASKFSGKAVDIDFEQESHMGGGGGVSAIQFNKIPLTIVGTHLAAGYVDLWKDQISSLSNFCKKEEDYGRSVIIAGDFNEDADLIKSSELGKYNLKSINASPTCPTFFKHMKTLDHIFIPEHWQVENSKTYFFESDHLAVFGIIRITNPLE